MTHDVTIPHGRWAYITKHESGGRYLYVSEKKLTMNDVAKWQNADTIESISVVGVDMVVFVK
jgi:hypothetical protein